MITDKDKENINNLASKLGIQVNNYQIYKEALTHRSITNELKAEGVSHNERLEFLGDAVLELVITEYLFRKFGRYQEGELTSFRAALVKTESLAEEALRLDYGEHLYMSRGEELSGGRTRQYILANTFEAIVGAIYLDNPKNGYPLCQEFIEKNLCHKLDKIVSDRTDIDSKTKLQEVAQEVAKFTPTYKLLSSSGPDHNKTFEMGVFVGEKLCGTGTGKSKQEAEQNAAAKALSNWTQNKSF